MRSRVSAGLLMYRINDGRIEVFLAHPGGPHFARKDDGHWTIPKGEVMPDEELLATAIREFQEETGLSVAPTTRFIALGSILQKGGKVVHAWAIAIDCGEPPLVRSNTFEMEWPPHSGRIETFPEVDRAQFFPLNEARKKIKETQIPLLDRLEENIGPLS